MSQLSPLNHRLSESDRHAYLDALGVTQWLPKNQPLNAAELSPPLAHQDKLQEPSAEKAPSAEKEPLVSGAENRPNQLNSEQFHQASEDLESKTPAVNVSATHETPKIEPDNQQPSSSTQAKTQDQDVSPQQSEVKGEQSNEASPQYYLKTVNWTNAVLSEENAKKLLIICRHQIEQPANSFARANSPSQFMTDFINCFNHLMAGFNKEFKVSLAHLSAAGLSEECVALSDAMQTNQPTAVLLLGDETVANLLGEALNVANARSQMHRLADGTPALVSYHPFDLIQNPALKRLAYEDLVLANELLTQEQAS